MQTERKDSVGGLWLSDRRELVADGVKEVISFDENGALMLTELGELSVEGSQIRISELDSETGKIRISGTIDALIYSPVPSEKKKGLAKRLFG